MSNLIAPSLRELQNLLNNLLFTFLNTNLTWMIVYIVSAAECVRKQFKSPSGHFKHRSCENIRTSTCFETQQSSGWQIIDGDLSRRLRGMLQI